MISVNLEESWTKAVLKANSLLHRVQTRTHAQRLAWLIKVYDKSAALAQSWSELEISGSPIATFHGKKTASVYLCHLILYEKKLWDNFWEDSNFPLRVVWERGGYVVCPGWAQSGAQKRQACRHVWDSHSSQLPTFFVFPFCQNIPWWIIFKEVGKIQQWGACLLTLTRVCMWARARAKTHTSRY